jgi:DNA-binding PadR family transcriptional regulator
MFHGFSRPHCRFARREAHWSREGMSDHHRHGRHGRGGRRVFDHGELRFVLLQLIASKPSHGYELIKDIEDRLGGTYSPSPGVVYPTLMLLEEQGFIEVSATEGSRKLYAVTDEGRRFLAENQAAVDAVGARMAQAASQRSAGEAPQLVRAMENLKLALRLRLASAPLTPEQVEAIAAALDAAATRIERI